MTEPSLDYLRFQSQCRLKESWARIIRRYQNVSNEETDVIDLITKEIIINRGIIQKDNLPVLGGRSNISAKFSLDEREKGKEVVSDNDDDDDDEDEDEGDDNEPIWGYYSDVEDSIYDDDNYSNVKDKNKHD